MYAKGLICQDIYKYRPPRGGPNPLRHRSVFTFIRISMSFIRFQESKQDLIGSSLLNKRETGSGKHR